MIFLFYQYIYCVQTLRLMIAGMGGNNNFRIFHVELVFPVVVFVAS